jgi:hypothetical protein
VIADPIAPPAGEDLALVAVQSALADRPGVLAIARGLSHFGEHSIGWLALAAVGALVSPRHRRDYLTAWCAGNGRTTRRSRSTWVRRAG